MRRYDKPEASAVVCPLRYSTVNNGVDIDLGSIDTSSTTRLSGTAGILSIIDRGEWLVANRKRVRWICRYRGATYPASAMRARLTSGACFPFNKSRAHLAKRPF